MRGYPGFAAIAFLSLALTASAAHAASGGTAIVMSQSGYLLDSSDGPITATVGMKARVYDALTDGVLQWEGTCAGVVVREGYYAVALGSPACVGTATGGLDATLDTSDLPPGQARWLELEVSGVVMTPRLGLSPLPAAIMAARAIEADRLEGHAAADFALTGHGHTIAGITGLQGALDAKLSTEADPKVGSLTEGKWCTASAGQIVCVSDPPAASTSGVTVAATAPASPAIGQLWFDTNSHLLRLWTGTAPSWTSLTADAPPSITSGDPGTAYLNLAYTFTFTATHPQGLSFTWGLAPGSSLPAGLSLATNGVLSGSPTAAGSSSFGVWATDSRGNVAAKAVSFTVVNAVPIALFSTTRYWADSTYAKSCNDYRNPPNGYAYIGSTGSAIYRISPAGTPFDAYCDMVSENGGWTLLGKQVAGMSGSDCTTYWTDAAAAGRMTPTPLPGTASGTTTRFPFSVFNQISATNPAGAYRVTSDYANSYNAYWKASCQITNWDTGTSDCFVDYATSTFTGQRRASTHNALLGVLQAHTNNGSFSDVVLAYTTFQQCASTPAVGYHNAAGAYVGYTHNAGLQVWFR